MIEQDNNGMKTPWTELELGNSCYSSYIVEPIFVPKETAFWLCRPGRHTRGFAPHLRRLLTTWHRRVGGRPDAGPH